MIYCITASNLCYEAGREALGERPDVLVLMLDFYKTDWYKASAQLYETIEKQLFQ